MGKQRGAIERGRMGTLPWAAVGSGPPVVLLAGLSPTTGFGGDGSVRAALTPLRRLLGHRRIYVLNRRPGLPGGLSMTELAAEHADAFVSYFDGPVDLVGLSTGGSIAQQVAAEHPDTVRRLGLISTACRLGPVGREVQARVATQLRAGQPRRAAATALGALAPAAGPLGRSVGWLAGRRVFRTPGAVADLVATIDAEDAFDLAGCAQAIAAPTLIVAGGRDRFYSRALFEETAELIPGSRLALFPDRGHIGVARERRATAQLAGFLDWDGGSGAEA